MNYLFDTDVLSALMSRSGLERLHQRLARVPARAQFTSSITFGELSFGAHRAGRLELLARSRLLLSQLAVLPFDAAAAEVYGPLRARLEKRGAKLDEADLRIASIAIANDCTLITGNVRHFARVDELRIDNWL